MPTARNARGVDIVAYSADASRFISIQVKSLSKRVAVPLGSSLENVMCDHWIVVNKAVTAPTAFILSPGEVKALAAKNEKNGKVSFWLDPPKYDQECFREAWGRLGNGGVDG